MIRVKRPVAAVVSVAVLFGAIGLWAAPPKPKADVTFKFTVTGVNQNRLMIAVEPQLPQGVNGTWDPASAVTNSIRFVTDQGGIFSFSTYTPLLQRSGPIPPPPPPPPIPSPLHVLIVYDAANPSSIPLKQSAIFASVPVKQFLDSHCAKDKRPDGTLQPAHRFLDKASDVSKMPADWQKVFARAAGKPLPWVIIANDAGASFEGPLPGNAADFLTLLKKYGG